MNNKNASVRKKRPSSMIFSISTTCCMQASIMTVVFASLPTGMLLISCWQTCFDSDDLGYQSMRYRALNISQPFRVADANNGAEGDQDLIREVN